MKKAVMLAVLVFALAPKASATDMIKLMEEAQAVSAPAMQKAEKTFVYKSMSYLDYSMAEEGMEMTVSRLKALGCDVMESGVQSSGLNWNFQVVYKGQAPVKPLKYRSKLHWLGYSDAKNALHATLRFLFKKAIVLEARPNPAGFSWDYEIAYLGETAPSLEIYTSLTSFINYSDAEEAMDKLARKMVGEGHPVVESAVDSRGFKFIFKIAYMDLPR